MPQRETQDKLNALLPADMRVTIDFRPDGDCESIAAPFYEIYVARDHEPKRIRRVAQKHSTPIDFAAMLFYGNARRKLLCRLLPI